MACAALLMAKKRFPIQRNANVQLAVSATTGMIHVNRALSRLNKRLYRSCRYYECKVDIDLSVADVGAPITVYALRDTWGHQKALQMAYDKFNETTAAERKALGKNMIARWLDFTPKSGSAALEMFPVAHDVTGTPNLLTGGEFVDSFVEDSSGTTKFFTWGSASATAYGIMAEYEKYSDAHNDPETVATTMAYGGQNEDQSDVEIDMLSARGNQPPYETNGFGDRWVKVATLSRVAGQQRLSTGFFTAPCGFVLITGLNASAQNPVELTVKAGDYKGVHAPSMLEDASSNKQLGYATSQKWKSMGVSTR